MNIDTHTHFYDPTRPQGVPWPPRDNEVLYRRVLPEHCRALAGPLGVTGTVVVEASTWVEDNQWVLDIAAKEPFIVGLVGNLPPGTEDFAKHIDRFAKNPLFRGIRVGVWKQLEEPPNPAFLADLEKMADRDLTLDVFSRPDGLPRVASLAGRIPDLRIVINHVASVRIDGKPPDPVWVQGIKATARHENVYMKVSGLVEATGLKPAPRDLSFYRPTLDALWEAFGEDRLVYGSNWPVCELYSDYATVHGIVSDYYNGKSKAIAEKYFWKNAKVAYKWVERR